LLVRYTEPVIQPDKEYDNLGVEDGRITKIGDRYIMVYTAYAFGTPANRIRLALASTKDFVHWKKHGLLRGNFNKIHNKNGMIFEKMMGNHYLMLHRPMEGRNAMSIHWAESNDVFGEWKSRGLLLEPFTHDSFIDTWIGGGAPPLFVSGNRFLILYHIGNRGSNGEKEYFLGFAVADFSSKKIIVKRDEPVLRPETPAETVPAVELGVANVLFPCGAYFFNGDLYMAYGGADSVVLGGKISKGELKKYLAS
jgi:beta-1,2-mannobiose phosphorylase / 1,2-beta-oligomannan phosphorylase